MTSLGMIQNKVNLARHLKLNISQQDFPDRDFSGDELPEKNSQLVTKRHSTVKSKVSASKDHHSSTKRSVTRDRSDKHHVAGGAEDNDDEVAAFGSWYDADLFSASKAVKPLQLKNSTAITRQSTRIGKEDLNEVLRKSLQKLEAKLDIIGLEQYVADSDESADNDNVSSLETGTGDYKRGVAEKSGVERKRKANNRGCAGSGKRARINSEEQAQIIAANINGTATDDCDAKLDRYLSSLLKNEANSSEILASLSDDFTSEITSVIESHFGKQSIGSDVEELSPSPAAEDLVDTETIMLNVLVHNLPGAYGAVPQRSTSYNDLSVSRDSGGDMLTNVADADILASQNIEPSSEMIENPTDLDHCDDSCHLGCLSIDTQWESQFVESSLVKSTHLNSVRDWRSGKMLDLLISGRLKRIPEHSSPELRHESTDKVVAGSLQNILNNLSWLWSVAVGNDMLDGMQDLVNNTASDLDSLAFDFMANSGPVDIPIHASMSTEQKNDDVSDGESSAKPVIDREDGWQSEEAMLLDVLTANLNDERQKLLRSSVDGLTAADDMYSPTRPTDLELALPGSRVLRPKGTTAMEVRNENEFLEGAELSDVLNSLVENSATIRRTVRIHKTENVASNFSEAEKSKHRKSGLTVTEQTVCEEDGGNDVILISDVTATDETCASDVRGVKIASAYDKLLVNESREIDEFFSEQTAEQEQHVKDDEYSSGHFDSSKEFDLSFENQHGAGSLEMAVTSQAAEVLKKSVDSSSGGKSHGSRSRAKKAGRSRKHKASSGDAIDKKSKKKARDADSTMERQLKQHVKAQLRHVQKGIESLLNEKHGIAVGKGSRITTPEISLRSADAHFIVLTGLSFDAKVALCENKVDGILKMQCSIPLLNSLLSELNIPLLSINISLQDHTTVVPQWSGSLMDDEKTATDLKRQVESPPTLRGKVSRKQSSVSRRTKSIDEAGVAHVVPARRQEAIAVTETEKRLMKADKLMQTFRRSQIAKRQSQRTSPQPAPTFIKQVQTITPSSELTEPTESKSEVASVPMDIVDADTSSQEPDFSTVITDGNMLSSVELPQVMSMLLAPGTDAEAMSEAPVDTVVAQAVHLVAADATVASTSIQQNTTISDSVGSSAVQKIVSSVSSSGKKHRVFVFNSEQPLCSKVEVCLHSLFPAFDANLLPALVSK